MRLLTATWQEVETYLKQSDGIIVPIGSIEQHGPNGPMHRSCYQSFRRSME